MFKLLLLLAILLAPVRARADDEWTATDKALGVTLAGTLAIDWAQTRGLSKSPWHELNPILGHHPGAAEINRYFAGVAATSFAIAHVLPHEYRGWFLGGATVLEVGVIAHNYRLGIKCNW
jgi:hypothetical protein